MPIIIQKENPVLRETAKEVPLRKIATHQIQTLLKDMSDALNTQPDGVAIAAPQIGVSLRIFVISKKVFDGQFINKGGMPNNGNEESDLKDMVFINPVLKKVSRDKEFMPEGCLSVRPLWGKVCRATKATVEAYDENGKKFTRGGSGLLAQIFQHEIDHFDGVLFIDKAKDISEAIPK